jgi:hypothetical protein
MPKFENQRFGPSSLRIRGDNPTPEQLSGDEEGRNRAAGLEVTEKVMDSQQFLLRTGFLWKWQYLISSESHSLPLGK